MTAAKPRTGQPTEHDLDPALLATSRTALDVLWVLKTHVLDAIGGVCVRCNWKSTSTQRGCPSVAVAFALEQDKQLPAWVEDLAVPGAVYRFDSPLGRTSSDAEPGLFPPLPRAGEGN